MIIVRLGGCFGFFFSAGGGEGEVRGAGRGGGAYFNPRRGGSPERGAEGPGGSLRQIGELGGGGLNIFCRGQNVHKGDTAHK